VQKMMTNWRISWQNYLALTRLQWTNSLHRPTKISLMLKVNSREDSKSADLPKREN
jgi:hypothetical protein